MATRIAAMRMKVLAAASALVLAAVAIGGTALAFYRVPQATIPTAVDEFRLVDNTGYAQELKRLVDVKAIVLVTQVNGAAGSRAAAKELEELKLLHPNVAFMMLNSSASDGRKEIVAEVKAQGWSIPVLDDAEQLVGEQMGASYAGEAYVIQPKTLK